MRAPRRPGLPPSLPVLLLFAALLAGCAAVRPISVPAASPEATAVGAAREAAALAGEREADAILAEGDIRLDLRGGVGPYMDYQEHELTGIQRVGVQRVDEDALLIRFRSDLLFEFNSSILSPTSQAALDEVARVVSAYRRTAVVIQGFTDSTLSEEFNKVLSTRRAAAVMDYLVGRGIDGGRITAVGYGEGQPVASNRTAQGRRQNRRVHIFLKARAR